MLKVQRSANGDVVFTVSGRLEADSVSELAAVLAAEPAGRALVLDLKDLVLVDRDTVRFLRACAGDRIALQNCPPYIRAWMARVEERPSSTSSIRLRGAGRSARIRNSFTTTRATRVGTSPPGSSRKSLSPTSVQPSNQAASFLHNGPILTDDVVDLFFSLLTNGQVTGDRVGPQHDLLDEFPYLGPPHESR
jgi:hypothetical protein